MKKRLVLAGLLAASLLPVAAMARDRDDNHERREQWEHRLAAERERMKYNHNYGPQAYAYRNQPYYGPYRYYGVQPYGYSQPYSGGVRHYRDGDHDRDGR